MKKTGTSKTLGYSAQGGAAFYKKHGVKGYALMNKRRWDRHYGRVCLNCDQSREQIEKKKLPCEKKVYIIVEEIEKFKKHEFNDPTKGKPPVRNPGKYKRTKKN